MTCFFSKQEFMFAPLERGHTAVIPAKAGIQGLGVVVRVV
jgi:hypothetical protein